MIWRVGHILKYSMRTSRAESFLLDMSLLLLPDYLWQISSPAQRTPELSFSATPHNQNTCRKKYKALLLAFESSIIPNSLIYLSRTLFLSFDSSQYKPLLEKRSLKTHLEIVYVLGQRINRGNTG